MKPFKKHRISTLLAAGAMLWSSASWAQTDIGDAVPLTEGRWGYKPVEVIQYGQRVGLVWVFSSGNPCQYTEYWYLSAEYVYPNSPGEGQTIDTVIRAIQGDGLVFDTPKSFFQYARTAMPSGKRILAPHYELENCGANHGG